MGCTSASRRGGPAWGSGGVTLSPSGPSAIAAVAASTGCACQISQRSGSLRGVQRARTGSVHRAAITLHRFRLGALSFPIGALRRAPLRTARPPGQDRGALTFRAGPRHCPADKRATLASRPFVLSGVTSGCCRRCSDLGRRQCRSLSRWDPVPLSSSRMCRSMSSRKNWVQDRRLRPRLHSRTRDPRKRSVKERVCVPCSPPFGMTRAACYWEALNHPGLGASVSWLQDGSPERLIARDCGEIGAGGPSCSQGAGALYSGQSTGDRRPSWRRPSFPAGTIRHIGVGYPFQAP